MIYDAKYIIDFYDLKNYDEEKIKMYIEHYTRVIKDRTKASDTTTSLFQDAVLAAIACKISKEDKSSLSSPNSITIGNYREEKEGRYQTNTDPSFCDLAKEALEALIDSLNSSFGFKVFKRQGASEKRGYYQ